MNTLLQNKITSITIITLIACTELLSVSQAQAYSNENTSDVEVIKVVNSHEFSRHNYQIIRREDFIHSAQNLSDILSQVNGIQIRKISGVGNPVSISIRGSSAKQVQFYIDGQLINDGQFGGFDLNQIPTEQIETIEISKSQALGTGATPIGGVIRINTYNPAEDTNKIALSLGSFGYQELAFMQNTAFKYHSLALGATYLASDNDYDYLVPSPLNDPNNPNTEPLVNNAFNKLSLFVNDSVQLGQHQLRSNISYNSQDKDLASYRNNSPNNNSSISSDKLRYSLEYSWISDINYLDTISTEYYGEDTDEDYQERFLRTKQSRSNYKTYKQHISIKPSFILPSLTFSPYIDASNETFSSLSLVNGDTKQCNSISACDLKATQQQFNLGGRLSWSSQSLPLTSYVLINRLSEDNSNITLNQTNTSKKVISNAYHTKELGVSYNTKITQSAVNWSDGVRTPTMFELFGDRGAFKGNSNLLPEDAETFSASLNYKDTLASVALTSTMAVYHQVMDNAIVAVFNTSGTGGYRNVSSAEIKGLEWQLSSQITNALSMSVQINLLDSHTNSAFVAFDNKKLPGIYHQQYSASLDYKFNKQWQIKINSQLDKALYFDRPNISSISNKRVTDLSVQWQLKNYRINFNCANLFNQAYQDLANRPAQGRSIQLKFSIEDI
jgi:vitamin B12 transporter